MNKSKFISVDTIDGKHIIRISEIIFVGPKRGDEIKSEIHLSKNETILYSKETQEEIHNKILFNEQQAK
jgi:hypothetical protein